MAQLPGLPFRQGQCRDVVQHGLDRQEVPREGRTMPQRFEFIQRNRLAFVKRPDGGAAQRRHVADGAERHRQVAGQAAHVGAFSRHRFELGVVAVRHRL